MAIILPCARYITIQGAPKFQILGFHSPLLGLDQSPGSGLCFGVWGFDSDVIIYSFVGFIGRLASNVPLKYAPAGPG